MDELAVDREPVQDRGADHDSLGRGEGGGGGGGGVVCVRLLLLFWGCCFSLGIDHWLVLVTAWLKVANHGLCSHVN